MKKTPVARNYEILSPSGKCRMGDTDVTFYRTPTRIWLDKKAIEVVLTGKNQHNLLGQYKDPKNHSQIFDSAKKEAVYVITETGVINYLQKARSVDDEHRHDFYMGMRSIKSSREDEKIAEPLQITMFGSDMKSPLLSIFNGADGYSINCTVDGKSDDEKRQNIAKMLISVANSIMTDDKKVQLKDVA